MELESLEERNGIFLMEVFSIIYLGDDDVVPENQLGTIEMESHSNPYLYKVDDVDLNKPTIKYGDPVMVNAKAPTFGFCIFDIKFDLFCGAYNGYITVDWEQPVYNEVSIWEEKMESQDGTGEIRFKYGLFGNASVANLEVNLLGNSGSVNVHGFVVASNSRLDPTTCASILFWEKSDNKIQVRDGVIPLSKSLVGVPLDSEFYVGISLICDDVPYKTKVTLVPQQAGTVVKNLFNGKLQVKVTWDADEDSIVSTYGTQF